MTHTALLEENSHLLDALNKAQEKALAIRADQKIDNAELHEINAAIGHVKERIAYLKAHPAGDTINQDNSPK